MLNPRFIVFVFFTGLTIYAVHLVALFLMQERRYSAKKTALLWGLAGIVTVLDLYFCFGLLPEPLRLPVSLLIAFFYYMGTFIYVSADGFWKKCYLFVTYACIFCIACATGLYLCYFFLPNRTETMDYLVRNILHVILYLPILLAYRKYGRPLIREVSGFRKRSWMTLSGVSVLYFCMFVILLAKIKMDNGIKPDILFFFIIQVSTFAVVNVLSISNIFHMRREEKEDLIKQNVEYLTVYVENARIAEEQARRIRHDKRHHDEQIGALAKAGDMEGILKYLQQEERISGNLPCGYCPNVTVSNILASYAQKAKEAGVAFAAEADTGKDSPIADVDFVAILANLLENALNGCTEAKSSGPVSVRLRMVGRKVVIVVSNPCAVNLKIENGLPKARSIGIDSILFAAGRYRGEVDYKAQEGTCTACVILNP